MSLASNPTLKGDEARLWKLIEQRTQPGADTKAIDQRIWDLFGEDWAVMVTDLAGFSRHVQAFGIIHFLQVIYEQKTVLSPIIDARDGILVKIEADSLLLLFKRARAALECALEMQRACQQLNVRRAEEERIVLCVGIGFGRILRVGDTDVYGAEVNAASKLGEDIARGDEILVTGAVRDAVGDLASVSYEPLAISVPGAEHAFRVHYPKADSAPSP